MMIDRTIDVPRLGKVLARENVLLLLLLLFFITIVIIVTMTIISSIDSTGTRLPLLPNGMPVPNSVERWRSLRRVG